MLIVCGPLFSYRNNTQLEDKAPVFIILPNLFDWIIIARIPVFGLSPFIIFFLVGKFYLKDDFGGYVDYSNRKSKYNAFAAIIPLGGCFALVGISLFYFLWNYGIFVYRDKIVVHWFLSTKAQNYSYDQIQSIRFTPATIEQDATSEVTFKDGIDWNTITGLKDADIAIHIQFISKRAGVKIDTIYSRHQ